MDLLSVYSMFQLNNSFLIINIRYLPGMNIISLNKNRLRGFTFTYTHGLKAQLI